MKILFTPNATGSGHNMRTLALAREILRQAPKTEITVLLASLQSTFAPMFRDAGINVVDIAGSQVDHATRNHLIRQMDWISYIGGYIAPHFVNGERLLSYLSLYQELEPDLIVSDYNLTASMAAAIGRVPHALVTERYDFTLYQLDDKTLQAGGFEVNTDELNQGRKALHALFNWIVDTAEIVLTDKPFVSKLDEGTAVAQALKTGHAVFTGPMIREIPKHTDGTAIREILNLDDGPLIVGSVGGTTMFLENKQRVIETYIAAYRLLKKDYPNLQFVLLGREQVQADKDVIVLPYLPDWMPLLQEADVLLSAPGWITVSEVAAMRIPTVFVLSSLSEYHEVEASQRLKQLDFPSLIAPDADGLASTLRMFIGNRNDETATPGQLAIAPDGSGTSKAAALLMNAVKLPLEAKNHDGFVTRKISTGSTLNISEQSEVSA